MKIYSAKEPPPSAIIEEFSSPGTASALAIGENYSSFKNLTTIDKPKNNFMNMFLTPKRVESLPSDSIKFRLAAGSMNSRNNVALNLPKITFPEPPIIYKDGHIYHELVPLKPFQDVEIEDEEDQNMIDRFSSDTDSDDEYSKSDMSTKQDYGFTTSSVRKNSTRQSSGYASQERRESHQHVKCVEIRYMLRKYLCVKVIKRILL
jgi:hypothetical protein